MKTKSTFGIDIAIVVFVVVLAVVYFGGYYFPQTIGNWTGLGMMAYLLVLVFAGLYHAAAYLTRSKNQDVVPQETKKGTKRS